MGKRYEELDSLRGIAAIVVVISHLVLTLPISGEKLKSTPFHFFWAGHEAVILFFVLSGFVLSLPYHNNKAPTYKEYLIKRICRIYIPYIISIIFSMVLMRLVSRMGIPDLSKWFNSLWVTPPSFQSIINHVVLLGHFEAISFNPVIWSMIHEMRISIIFPFIMYFVIKNNWKKNLIMTLSIPILFFLTYYFCLKVFKFDMTISTFNESSYLRTIHYVALFMLGAILAKCKQSMTTFYNKLTFGVKLLFLVVGLISYSYSWWFFLGNDFFHLFLIDDWMIAIGASIFIVLCINSNTIKRIILFKPIHFMGKISYSLYLFHVPVMLILVNILYNKLPILLILTMSFICSIVVASMMYYVIEKPAIRLGRIVASKKKFVLHENNLKAQQTV